MADKKPATPMPLLGDLFPGMVDVVCCNDKGQNPYPMRVRPENVIAISYFTEGVTQIHFVDGTSVYALEPT